MRLPSADKEWFVVRARSGAELIAAEELEAGGYETYVPMMRKRNLIGKNRLAIVTHQPLMRSYVFLATETGRTVAWASFRDNWRMRHVGRPLRGLYGPLRIPGKLVVKIHEDEVDGKFDETGATKKANHAKLAERFFAGATVRASDGPFSGFLGPVQCVTPHDRIKALMNIFGRMVAVEFDVDQLEVA